MFIGCLYIILGFSMHYQKTQCQDVEGQDEWIIKHEFIPDNLLGGVIFIHGLGDHSRRNSRPIQHFVNYGIYCIAIDLPGHGLSFGVRGHLLSLEYVYNLIEKEITYLKDRLPVNVPLGIIGHSMGGGIALNYLSVKQYQEKISFAWISSPLVKIPLGENRLLYSCLQFLDNIVPKLTITYRLNSLNCKRDPAILEETRVDTLIHKKVTIHLIKLLIEACQVLPKKVKEINPKLKFLMTHGDADTICSSHFSRQLFDIIPSINKDYILFKDLLHETFHDIGKEKLYEVPDQWISSILKQ